MFQNNDYTKVPFFMPDPLPWGFLHIFALKKFAWFASKNWIISWFETANSNLENYWKSA